MKYLADEANLNAPELPDTEEAEIARELRSLWHGLLRDCERANHLERQQYWVLSATFGGAKRMSQLAEEAQTSQASLTGIVDRLEDRGLVERVRSSEDRRVVEVSATDEGRQTVLRMKQTFSERLGQTLSPLSAEERTAFLSMLRRINAHHSTCERG